MKRSKKYEKFRKEHNPDQELSYLRHECYKLIDRILAIGEIKKQDLFIALAIRLGISVDKCYIKNFDQKMLEKAVKELTYML